MDACVASKWVYKRDQRYSATRDRVEGDGRRLTGVKTTMNVGPMTTLLFTIEISATYRGTQEIYSAQVIACNGEKLYHVGEALSFRKL